MFCLSPTAHMETGRFCRLLNPLLPGGDNGAPEVPDHAVRGEDDCPGKEKPIRSIKDQPRV
jgi:hypothetical protein